MDEMFRVLSRFFACFVLGTAQLCAHTVPGITVEVEFTPGGEASILVNLDPRLILEAPPSTIPPLPAAWWLDQQPAEQEATRRKASAFIAGHLQFFRGEAKIEPLWKIEPVDGATLMVFAPTSAEVHLIARHRALLPSIEGSFGLRLARHCLVPVLLIQAMEGATDRQPQLVLPGETSRPFPLPASAGAGKTQSAPPVAPEPQPAPGRMSSTPLHHDWPAHVLFAAALVFMLRRSWCQPLLVLLLFHLGAIAGTNDAHRLWLPPWNVSWTRNCWFLLPGLVAALFAVRKQPKLALIIAFAGGMLHGWAPVPPEIPRGAGSFTREEGLLIAMEAATVAVALVIRRLIPALNAPRSAR